MTDTWINWRFGVRHLQIGPWFIRWTKNPYWIGRKGPWFERY